MELSKKIKLCFALLFVHVVLSIFTVMPGHFSIDEILYHLMTKSFVETGGFEIWNGYQEFSSSELVLNVTLVHNGRHVSQYPYLYPVLAAPFYQMMGFRGLFALNAIAFVGVVILTYLICLKLFKKKNMSLNACLILTLATYAWGYSQAAWPHMTSAFFVMAAFYFFLCAFYGNDSQKSFYCALSCGFISGLAIGIRLDSIFVLPCFIFAFFFLKPWRPKLGFWTGVGAIPGLVLLSATNYIKFGVISPFSYGRHSESIAGISEIAKYLPLALLVFGAFLIFWIITRYPVISVFKRHGILAVFLLISLVLSLFIIPQFRTMFLRTANGAFQLLIDFRIRDLGIIEGALSRSSGGGMIYIGGLKKSLFQSCPYLVVLIIPFLRILKGDKYAYSLILLFFIPLTYIGFYSFSGGWHGGQSLNLRYFVPILPFTSVLTAFSLDRVMSGMKFLKNKDLDFLIFLLLLIFSLLSFVFFQRTLVHPDEQELYCLDLPLILAGISLSLLVFCQVAFKKSRILHKVFVTSLLVSMIWSGIMGIMYDYRIYHREQRRYNLEISNRAAAFISDDAILFTDQIDAFSRLIEKGKVRIANPFKDKFEDFDRLVNFYLSKGTRVYFAFHVFTWRQSAKSDLLNKYEIQHFKISDSFISGQVINPKTSAF